MDGPTPPPTPRPAGAWADALPDAHRVLGHPVHPVDLRRATELVLAACAGATPRLVVTLNPELVVRARDDAALRVPQCRIPRGQSLP